MKATPTKVSLALLKKEGYVAEVVEHWIPKMNIRRDLFGIIDILAIKEGQFGAFGIQCTSKANISSRIKKAMSNPKILLWLKTGNTFEVWGSYKENNKWLIEKRELVKRKYLPKTSKLVAN